VAKYVRKRPGVKDGSRSWSRAAGNGDLVRSYIKKLRVVHRYQFEDMSARLHAKFPKLPKVECASFFSSLVPPVSPLLTGLPCF
jgi:hypothetical protein